MVTLTKKQVSRLGLDPTRSDFTKKEISHGLRFNPDGTERLRKTFRSRITIHSRKQPRSARVFDTQFRGDVPDGKGGFLQRASDFETGQKQALKQTGIDSTLAIPSRRSFGTRRSGPRPVAGFDMNFGNFFPSQRPDRSLDSVSLLTENGKKKGKKKKKVEQKPLKSIFDLSF